ncbi:swollenin [Xylogone sp. PMI_703]|nr:swollenin [Xylogone sp. PMI_703]
MLSKSIALALAGIAGLVSTVHAQACAAEWAQCGGINFTGATCCQAPLQCVVINDFYYQCQQPSSTVATSSRTTTTARSSSTTTSGRGSSTTSSTRTTTSAGPPPPGSIYTTSVAIPTTSHNQSPYPSAAANSCGAWSLVDNVCCPAYCENVLTSEDCDYPASQCGSCISPPSADCKSGTMYNETTSVGDNEDWHYSRSTHFGLTSGGACGFGLYGLCTKGSADSSWIDPQIGATCSAFCTAYPTLCQDPTTTDLTLRGNFAAPNGDYYTQFWNSLSGDLDNYLSCGECFELVQTKPDGTDYAQGEAGYTSPIILEVVDSCPCDANSKWCCGPGADHCAEIDFKYGCPLPADSIHLDLSDIAMGRLQGGGSLTNGVIPTRYKRVPCPVPGNVYLWLHDGGGPYYFTLAVVNTAGLGSVTTLEVKGSGQTTWTALIHDPNYTSSRPQERYGSWTIPQGTGPFNPPLAIRITNPAGEQIVNNAAITSFTAPASAPAGYYYIDFGAQFST